MEIYGDSTPDSLFVDSIKNNGFENPIKISSDNVIIGGHRRFKAAQILKLEEVPVIVVSGNLLVHFLEDNRQREKNWEMLANEKALMKEIETEKAKERQSEGGRKGKPNTLKDKKKVTDVSKPTPQSSDIVAKQYGVSRPTLEKELKILDAAKKGNKKAKDAVKKLNSQKKPKIATAYKDLFEQKPEFTQEELLEKAKKDKINYLRKLGTKFYEILGDVEKIHLGEITLDTPEEVAEAQLIIDCMRKAIRIGLEQDVNLDTIKKVFKIN